MSTKMQLNNLPASAVLFLVHLLYSFVERLLNFSRWLHRKFSTRWNSSQMHKRALFEGDVQKLLRLEGDAIQYGVRELEKIPSHLVVMLGPEVPDYKQLARFIFWGMAAGVGHVSFYDHKGILKRNHHQMLHYVSKQPRADSEQIVWTPQLKPSNGLLPPRNGYRRRVVVSFFSPEDGKRQLVAVAKSITSALRDGSIHSPADITPELVDRKLQDGLHRVPDPDLAVYFGSICSTYGMLPWQIRLTEFAPLEAPSLGEAGIGHFLNCLYQYARCEQRFGK